MIFPLYSIRSDVVYKKLHARLHGGLNRNPPSDWTNSTTISTAHIDLFNTLIRQVGIQRLLGASTTSRRVQSGLNMSLFDSSSYERSRKRLEGHGVDHTLSEGRR